MMENKISQPGHFYAIGVGPGDPDLLTLRAAHLVESADVIFAPQSKKSKSSLALQAVAPLLKDQEIVVSQYPMERDNDRTRDRWKLLAADVADRCQRGQSVVQVTLGDPLIFATSSYLLEALAEILPAALIHVEPGISAFQMTASCFTDPLTLQEDRLMIMSATDLVAVENALDQCETLVLFKAAGDLSGARQDARLAEPLGPTLLHSPISKGFTRSIVRSRRSRRPSFASRALGPLAARRAARACRRRSRATERNKCKAQGTKSDIGGRSS
jgi:precorrin-2/cobalt-factor-2 C20-methyltransferase